VKDYNNLLLKVKYLYAKIDYQQEVFEQAKIDFEEYARKFCEENGIEIEFPEMDDKTTDINIRRSDIAFNVEDVEAQSIHIKKLFRKIAIMTHPDKLTKLDDYERDRKTELFLKAREAAEAGRWFALVSTANELGIETPNPDEEQVGLLNSESESIDNEIEGIEATYAWLMYTLNTDEQRKLLMTTYLKVLGVHFGEDTD
jgi:hypothetical protein|tara:strand:- start:985 stop:1584 length:600 start_codon:yes stop_codon:yes gene_type:complete